MSPIEFSIAVAAWREDQEAIEKRDRVLAWHIANLAGAAFGGNLPAFEKFVGIARKAQTPQQMEHVLRAIKGGRAA